MLVGEVRCATTATGCSWKLSGGSQLSSGPTYSSKKPQVFRDTLRRKVVCSTLSRAGRRRRGRLSHQALAGAAAQSASSGPATPSADGRPTARPTASTPAAAGALQIAR